MRTETLAIAAVALLGIAGCGRKPAPTPIAAAVRVAPFGAPAGRSDGQTYVGTVRAIAEVPVSFRVGGYVVEVAEGRTKGELLDKGDAVTAGQVLAQVRQADYAAPVAQARSGLDAAQATASGAGYKLAEAQAAREQAGAGLAEAQAKRQGALTQLAEAQEGKRIAESMLDEAQAGRRQAVATLAQAEAGSEKAQADFERVRKLYAARCATRAEYDAARAANDASAAGVRAAKEAVAGVDAKVAETSKQVNVAASRIAGARSQVRAADAAVRRYEQVQRAAAAVCRAADAQVRQAQAGSRAAAAQLSTAQLALGDSTLKSPLTGVVLARRVDNGALVGPGAPGFVVADIRVVKVSFGVPDEVARALRLGRSMSFTVEGLAGGFVGVVTSVSAAADPKTRLFDVDLRVSNPTQTLKPGMVAQVAAEAGRDAVSAVPIVALVRGDQASRQAVYVVVAEGGKTVARRRDLQVGKLVGNSVEVLSGLKPGDEVVIQGASLLHDGSEVEVMR